MATEEEINARLREIEIEERLLEIEAEEQALGSAPAEDPGPGMPVPPSADMVSLEDSQPGQGATVSEILGSMASRDSDMAPGPLGRLIAEDSRAAQIAGQEATENSKEIGLNMMEAGAGFAVPGLLALKVARGAPMLKRLYDTGKIAAASAGGGLAVREGAEQAGLREKTSLEEKAMITGLDAGLGFGIPAGIELADFAFAKAIKPAVSKLARSKNSPETIATFMGATQKEMTEYGKKSTQQNVKELLESNSEFADKVVAQGSIEKAYAGAKAISDKAGKKIKAFFKKHGNEEVDVSTFWNDPRVQKVLRQSRETVGAVDEAGQPVMETVSRTATPSQILDASGKPAFETVEEVTKQAQVPAREATKSVREAAQGALAEVEAIIPTEGTIKLNKLWKAQKDLQKSLVSTFFEKNAADNTVKNGFMGDLRDVISKNIDSKAKNFGSLGEELVKEKKNYSLIQPIRESLDREVTKGSRAAAKGQGFTARGRTGIVGTMVGGAVGEAAFGAPGTGALIGGIGAPVADAVAHSNPTRAALFRANRYLESGGRMGPNISPRQIIAARAMANSNQPQAAPDASPEQIEQLRRLQGQAERPEPVNPITFPRSTEALVKNKDRFIDAMGKEALRNKVPPEVAGELVEATNQALQSGNAGAIRQVLTEVSKKLPGLFRKSPYPSLWDDRLHADEDKDAYAAEMDEMLESGELDAHFVALQKSELNKVGPAKMLPRPDVPGEAEQAKGLSAGNRLRESQRTQTPFGSAAPEPY